MSVELGEIVEGAFWTAEEFEDDLFLKKGSGLSELFQSILSCDQRQGAQAKVTHKPMPRSYFITCAGGKWSASAKVDKDDQGNTKGSANVNVEKKTESGMKYSFEVGVDAKKDKDQKVETGAHGAVAVSGEF